MKCDSIVMVLGKPYRVVYADALDTAGNMGNSNRNAQYVNINRDQAEEQKQDTLLHEVIHIIDKELMLNMDEELVCRLAVGLHSAGCIVREMPLNCVEGKLKGVPL